MATLPPTTRRTMQSQLIAFTTAFVMWVGSFVLLWMLCRFIVGDPIFSLLMAGLGLATVSPLLGVMSSPPGAPGHGQG